MRSTVNWPVVAVLIGTFPLGSLARPDSPSFAFTVACTFSPCTAVVGHSISSVGAVASTCTVRQPFAERLPTLSSTSPHAGCAPLVLNVIGVVKEAGSTPLGELPSASVGSPCAVKETVTLSLYQPPLPAEVEATRAQPPSG